jgi:sulfur carrier protein
LLDGGTIAVPPKAASRLGEAAFLMPESASSFTIQLNGEDYTVDGDARLPALLERLRMRRGRIAVEVNQAVVPRAQYDSVTLKPGDRVEIVNFVGGG